MLDDLKQLVNTSRSTPKRTAITDANMMSDVINDYVARWGIDEAIHHIKVWLYLAEKVRDNK